MGMDLAARVVAIVREAVGIPDGPMRIDRLAFYPCRVDAAASDGSTLDVTPQDSRIPPQQSVKLRVGIPGAVAVAQAGATVLLSWDGGDPKKPYCVPSWEAGATVTKLVVNAQSVYLGGESGAQPVHRQGDHEDVGSLTLTVGGSATLAWTYVDPDGTTHTGASGSAIALKGKANSGSSVVSAK